MLFTKLGHGINVLLEHSFILIFPVRCIININCPEHTYTQAHGLGSGPFAWKLGNELWLKVVRMWGTLNYHQEQSLCSLQLFQLSSNTGAEHHRAWSLNTSLVGAAFLGGPGLTLMCSPQTHTQTCASSLFWPLCGSSSPLTPPIYVPLSPSTASSSPMVPGAGTPAHSKAAALQEFPEIKV